MHQLDRLMMNTTTSNWHETFPKIMVAPNTQDAILKESTGNDAKQSLNAPRRLDDDSGR
jgi:hypothetical protein